MGKSSVSAEYLNLHWFHTIDDAKGKIKAWRTYPGTSAGSDIPH